MPKLKIDGYEIDVPKGTKVIVAAEQLGIFIPRFCYHAGLGSVGACRMCAVKFLEGPVKGVQMSCMVDAQEGMAVSTTDEEAVDFRKHVIEWLMMNHPHDCPVCDEGGHCLLQDMTVAGGHGVRRYLGKKRTYRDQSLGIFVQHEMNRCIHCWRCRRFYQDFAGYRDLGAMQIANHTYFGRAADGPLESPFAGNLIDLCPTGVYTDKPSRFKGRRWDFERSPSLCIHCSLGCHTIASARYREIVRLEAGFNEAVNGYFICDRGRYGFYYNNHPERGRRARVGTEEASLEKALRTAAERLSQIAKSAGPKSIASMGSIRSSLENQAMLKRLCRLQGYPEPGYFADPSIQRKVCHAVSRLDSRLAVSMGDIEKADFILVIGADPVNEAPVLTLAIRQAYRKGVTVAVVDPRPVFLPFDFDHFPVAPREIDLFIRALMKGAVNRSALAELGSEALRFYDAIPTEHPFGHLFKSRFSDMTQKLQKSQNPLMVCGTDIVQETTPAMAADCSLLLRATKKGAGLFYVMPGANAFGAALLSSEDASFAAILENIEKGTVKALLLVESDPFWFFPDRQRWEKALRQLDLLLVMDYLPSRSTQDAHIFIPTRTLFETEGSFINQEGRVQLAPATHCGGIPIEQLTRGEHPPRLFRSDIPGGEPRAAWQVLAELSEALSPLEKGPEMTRSDLWQWMAQEDPAFTEGAMGGRISSGQRDKDAFSLNRFLQTEGSSGPEGGLQLVLGDWTFGTEELAAYSRCIQQVEKEPCLFLHPRDAAKLKIGSNDKIALPLDGGILEVDAQAVDNMAPGVMFLPRHRQLLWQKMRDYPVWVPLDRMKKM